MINIVLVEPEKPGNVGAIARTMKNFDFSNLVLIRPKCDIHSIECLGRAKHAKDVILKSRTLKEMPAYDYKIATTAQLGTDFNISRSPITPEQLADKLSDLDLDKTKIALIFGREGTGLSNKEINECDFLVTIQTSKKYPTMNLSHSVTAILYELHKKIGKQKIGEHIVPIGDAEKKQIMKMMNKIFNQLKFSTKEKKQTQQKTWKRIISKSFMTKREAYAVMGFFRKIIEKNK